MSGERKTTSRSGETLVALAGVSIRGERDRQPLLEAEDFRLVAGRTAHVAVESDARGARCLGDVLCGIRPPDAGEVCAFGRAWTGYTPREAAERRARFGRVFSGLAWLSNLNVDENILLAARHHTSIPEEELRERAERWAGRFGLPGLPDERPAWVGERTSQLAQWVRAFMMDPDVLILQDPVSAAVRDDAPALTEALTEAEQRGAAVCWMDRAHPHGQEGVSFPGRPERYVLRRSRLSALGGSLSAGGTES